MYNAMNNLTYNETKVNLEYKALHGFYWMLYCLTTGYTTVLLLSHGFSSSVIGVIAAVSSILAAVGQLGGRKSDGANAAVSPGKTSIS